MRANSATKAFLRGYRVFAHGPGACVEDIVTMLKGADGKGWLACLNPHSYVTAKSDIEFDRALRAADWLVPDGVGVVLASKLLGCGIDSRVTGWHVFSSVNTELDQLGGRSVFFVGSSEENLSAISIRFARDYPNLRLTGTYAPPFKDEFSSEDDAKILAAINSARPDVLWVGMTAPKQEKWIHRVVARADVRFVGAIGAVFDFYSGRIRRPGRVAQGLGMEWLVRLLREPRRLWQRTFVSGPRFFADVVRVWVSGRSELSDR